MELLESECAPKALEPMELLEGMEGTEAAV